MAKATKDQYEVEEEQVEQAPTAIKLTKDMLSPGHRAKAQAKLCQAQTPEVLERTAQLGLWLIAGVKQQFNELLIVTGLPEWIEGEKGSIYTYTALAVSGQTEQGDTVELNKVITIRFQGSALQAAQVINAAIFDLPEGENVAAFTVGTKFVKGSKGSWFTPTVSPQTLTDAARDEAARVGITE